MSEQEVTMATDDTKPAEHPAPWRWNAEPGQHGGWLLDANNATVVGSQVDTKFDDDLPTSVVVASPYARELIRLAPSMADLLRTLEAGQPDEGYTDRCCPSCDATIQSGDEPERYGHFDGCKLAAILAALDAARKGP